MHDADIAAILARAAPQTYHLARREGVLTLLAHGLRDLLGSPHLAFEVLGTRGSLAVASALEGVGERHVSTARRLRELAAAEPSRPATACSGRSCNVEVET